RETEAEPFGTAPPGPRHCLYAHARRPPPPAHARAPRQQRARLRDERDGPPGPPRSPAPAADTRTASAVPAKSAPRRRRTTARPRAARGRETRTRRGRSGEEPGTGWANVVPHVRLRAAQHSSSVSVDCGRALRTQWSRESTQIGDSRERGRNRLGDSGAARPT